MSEKLNLPDMPANSQRAKEAQAEAEKKKTVPKPVLQNATPQKDGLWNKIKSTFLQGRNPTDVAAFVITGVLLPAVIDGVANASKAAIDMALYGDTKIQGGNKNNLGLGVGQTNYNRMSTSPGRVTTMNGQTYTQGVRTIAGCPRINFATNQDAQAVADYLFTVANEYDMVTLADYLDACGDYAANIPRSHIQNKYAWMRGTQFVVARSMGSWIIDLPEPVSI